MTRPVLPLPMSARGARLAAPTLTAALLLSACAGAPAAPESGDSPAGAAFPVTMTNCGHEVTVDAAPSHVLTLNQGATEVVLALGLSDRLAGTAYLDDAVSPAWAEEYHEVPVLSKEYPTNEQVLAAEPDLVYASYASAFDAKVAGERDVLAASGVGTYLSGFGCPEAEERPDASFEAVWDEVRDVAALLGEPDAAEQVVSDQQATLEKLADDDAADDVSVVWWDAGTKAPSVGAGDGGPALVMDAVGADNVFDDLDGSWADGSWEDVLAADPDVIVLVDAAWDPAAQKRRFLLDDPVLSQLDAVAQERFVVVPFSASTPGVRLVEGAQTLADGIATLGLADRP